MDGHNEEEPASAERGAEEEREGESWPYRRHQVPIINNKIMNRKKYSRCKEAAGRSSHQTNTLHNENTVEVDGSPPAPPCPTMEEVPHLLQYPQISEKVMKVVQESIRRARQYDFLKATTSRHEELLVEQQIIDSYMTSNIPEDSLGEEVAINECAANGDQTDETAMRETEEEVYIPSTYNSLEFSHENRWFNGELNVDSLAEFDVGLLKRRAWDGSKQYACSQCDKWFTKKYSLYVHGLIHAGVKKFHCQLCESKFKTSGELKRHQLTHSGEKNFSCEICQKEFVRSGDLRKHQLIHKGEKKHECTECFRRFTQSGDLKRHYYTHSGERRYGCDICERRFTRMSDLKHHKLVHTGKKDCMCDLCGKYFKSQREMKRHRLVHDQVKKFACNFCDKRFSQLPGLQQHKVVHSGERKHQCDVCNKRFTQSGTLKRHKLIHDKAPKKRSKKQTLVEVNVEFENFVDDLKAGEVKCEVVEAEFPEVCVKIEETSSDYMYGGDDQEEDSRAPTMCIGED